jgi:L-fuconolactonase
MASAVDARRPRFREASAFSNVLCKLSGLVTEADWTGWTADDFRPYAGVAFVREEGSFR